MLKSRKELAQTMVEFALVFPVLLVITYGIIEIGRVVFLKAAVTSASREGARFGAAAGDVLINNPQYANCSGIRGAVKGHAFLINIPDSNITIRYDRGPGLPVIASTCENLAAIIAGGADPIRIGNRVIVHVTAQYTPMIPFLGINGFQIVAESSRSILVGLEFK